MSGEFNTDDEAISIMCDGHNQKENKFEIFCNDEHINFTNRKGPMKKPFPEIPKRATHHERKVAFLIYLAEIEETSVGGSLG